MERLRGFPRRFRFPWRSAAQIRRDVDDELAFHLAEKTEALQREGMSVGEAREEALHQFGDLDGARERLVADDRRGERRSRWLTVLDDLVRDTRIAARSLRRTPGFTVVAVVVLALGIGVVSGAFNLLNALALKPTMMAEPENVLGIFAEHSRPSERPRYRAFSYPEYEEIREKVKGFSSVAAFDFEDAGIDEGGTTRRASLSFVSANYFDTLGVPLAQGRAFTLAEERGKAPAVAVVSYGFWIRNGADAGLLGSVVRVNGVPLIVVGIAPRGFTGTTALIGSDVWVPLAAMEQMPAAEGGEPAKLRERQHRPLLLFGRLADGISAVEAEAELATLAPRIDANFPDPNGARYTYIAGELGRTSVSTGPNPDEGLTSDVLLPAAMSLVVLAIACLNLANMFLAQGASRRTEMAIRQSLGSGRARLVRQLLTEGAVLALLGGIAGFLWSWWAAGWMAASLGRAFPVALTIVIDARPDAQVVLVTVATCIAAILLFGLGPAWRVTGMDVLGGLKEGAPAAPFGRRKARTSVSGRSLMLVAQIALSLVMLIAGGLFLRSALFAARAMPAFDLDRTLVVELDPGLVGEDEIRSRALFAKVMERLRALPEVDRAGMSAVVPFSGLSYSRSVQPAGLPPGEGGTHTLYSVVDDGYFGALRLPILRGRAFSPAETASNAGPRVAIIDEPLARRLFPDTEPLGRQIQFASSAPAAQRIPVEVVGIVAGAPGADFDPAPRPHVYLPFGQAYVPDMNVVVAVGDRVADASSLLPTIRDGVRAVDPSLPVLTMTTMREVRGANWSLGLRRMGGRLFTLLGGLALFLAMVGLYGVRAFLMSRRTREIGVRMALGATREAVLRQMMAESMRLTVAGLVLGWVLALAAGRILSSLLYKVSAADPWVFFGATAFLALAAVVASWLPVRRALRVQPSAALRHE